MMVYPSKMITLPSARKSIRIAPFNDPTCLHRFHGFTSYRAQQSRTLSHSTAIFMAKESFESSLMRSYSIGLLRVLSNPTICNLLPLLVYSQNPRRYVTSFVSECVT